MTKPVLNSELSQDFDQSAVGSLRLNLGLGFVRDLITGLITVRPSLLMPLAAFNITGNANVNAPLTIGEERTDAGWSLSGTTVTYTGNPDRVTILAQAYYDEVTESSAKQRVSPEMFLFKNGVRIAASNGGYQRHAIVHASSFNAIAITDHSPGANPQYQLVGNRGSTQTDVINIVHGSFSLTAMQ